MGAFERDPSSIKSSSIAEDHGDVPNAKEKREQKASEKADVSQEEVEKNPYTSKLKNYRDPFQEQSTKNSSNDGNQANQQVEGKKISDSKELNRESPVVRCSERFLDPTIQQSAQKYYQGNTLRTVNKTGISSLSIAAGVATLAGLSLVPGGGRLAKGIAGALALGLGIEKINDSVDKDVDKIKALNEKDKTEAENNRSKCRLDAPERLMQIHLSKPQ